MKLLAVTPGALSLEVVLREFAAKGPGIVTSFSEARVHALYQMIDEDSPLEVLAYGEAVGRTHAIVGGTTGALAQSGSVQAAVAEACSALPEDSPFLRTASFPGLHRRLVRALGELREWGLDAEGMEALAEKCQQDLQRKMISLAAIERRATETLAMAGRMLNSARVKECLDLRPERGVALGRFLVVAGNEFGLEQALWLNWIADCGAPVTVVLDGPINESGVFQGTRRYTEVLGGELIEAADPARPHLNALFTENSTEPKGLKVSIRSVSDPLAEAEWALRGCLEEHARLGSLERIAILARNLEDYAPLLDAAARRLEVPLRMARRVPLLSNGFAKLVLAMLRFCAGNDVRSLIPLLKSTYLGLSREARHEIADAVREAFRARERQWDHLAEWARVNEEKQPWLVNLLSWRHEALQSDKRLGDWGGILRGIFDAIPWQQAALAPTTQTRARDLRAQTALQRSLAQTAVVHHVRERERISLRAFVAAAESIWEEAEVTIAPGESGVRVISSAEEAAKVDALFVLGMLEGVFPRRRSEDPILNDKERATLSSLRPEAPPLADSHTRARSERDEFFRVCATPSSHLVFSYPQTDEDRDNVRAFYLQEVERAFGGSIEKEDLPRQRLAPRGDGAAPADRRLSAALEGPREEPLPNALATDAVRFVLNYPAEKALAPRELRDVLECPFRHLARRRLNVPRSERRTAWGRLRRLPERAGLAEAATREEASQALHAALEGVLDEVHAEVSPWEMAMMRAGGRRLVDEWVDREFRARDLWPFDRGSFRRDVRFGEHVLRDSMKAKGRDLRLAGGVPAMYEMGPYLVMRIYESSPPEEQRNRFEPDLDMFVIGLHLLAAWRTGGTVAAETDYMSGERRLYLQTRSPSFTVPSRAAEGLKVVDVLSTLREPVLDGNELETYMAGLKDQIATAVTRIAAVEVRDTPGQHCKWCDFGELCRRSAEFGEQSDPFEDQESDVFS